MLVAWYVGLLHASLGEINRDRHSIFRWVFESVWILQALGFKTRILVKEIPRRVCAALDWSGKG